MKVCPFCKEEIKEEATKCRFCQSDLSHVGRSDKQKDRVTYILDRDLIRFIKFSGAVISILLVAGTIQYESHLKDLADDITKSTEKSEKLLAEAQTMRTQTAEFLEQAKSDVGEIRQQRVISVQETAIISERLSETASTQGDISKALTRKLAGVIPKEKLDQLTAVSAANHTYTEAEVLTLVKNDVGKATAYFKRFGLHPPSIQARIDSDRTLANAFWDSKSLVYGMGMVNSDIFGPYEGGVVFHNATHALFTLTYSGQSGAISESVCDVIAVAIRGEGWTIGYVRSADPAKPAFLRSLKDPGSAYDSPELGKDPQPSYMDAYVNTTDDNGGVHINEGILNKAAYLISEGGTFRGTEVEHGLGREKLGQLYLRVTQKFPVNGTLDFHGFREIVAATAQEVFGSGEAQTVRQAFTAVGVV